MSTSTAPPSAVGGRSSGGRRPARLGPLRRLRQTSALLGPLAAAVRWQPFAGAALLVAGVVAWKAPDVASTDAATGLLRAVAVILACSACFVLDDDAADVCAPSPTTLAWRRLLRVTAAAALVTLLWAGAVFGLSTAPGVDVPLVGLTLELAALVTLGLAAAAVLDRWTGVPDPGVGASPLVFASALLATRLPERWALVVPPGPAWTDAHVRWAVLLVCSVLVLGWLTRDPATRARLSPRR